jgi:sec-independent protein translocase protein TatC
MNDSSKNEKEEVRTERRTRQHTAEMSFLEHLEELRWHIIRSLLSVLVFALLAFIFKSFIFDTILFKPMQPDFFTNRMFSMVADLLGSESIKINQEQLKLINITMAGMFSTHIYISLIAGCIIASPYIIYQFWSFIKPALYEKEKKYASGAVVVTSILFILGILFGYYLIVPLTISFFGSYSISKDVVNQINVVSYLRTVASTCFAAGVVFLLPVFSYFLAKVGILSSSFMKSYRKHSYVALLFIAAVITPPDVFSQIIVCIPLVALYEASIMIVKGIEKGHK